MLNIYKRSTLWAGALLLALSSPAAAGAEAVKPADTQKDVMKNVASYQQWNTPFKIVYNGKPLQSQGIMIGTRMLVPVRELFEAAGAAVTWDADTQTLHVQRNGLSLAQKLGQRTVIVNGTSYELDNESLLENGSFMASEKIVPLALGSELRWDSAGRTLAVNARPDHESFHIKSAAFNANEDIPVQYAHGGVAGGRNISLPVSWEGAPQGTKSYAVVMYDIHPIADNFIHWSVLNLPASTNRLEEGAAGHLPEGTELNAYFGMEPPRYSGDHLYRVVVFALDTEKLEVANAPVFFEQLEPILKEHTLAFAELDGFFKQ
ncbi:YbhB/YbcL family Raf kinase inhibitor-like protein [Paenibacillus hamazuiensis]|uniref:YbhB/YbcL family Raf kinase inhibitor-like protein n=1 Tax=Paenibacillus hamazuiensis TaxID=2936508 RepID=UPI00200E961A|nr:YbhB/YbcL family Raf kinase inhibitor-like protein [Paenibacillus hamazuiensis]